MKPDELPVVMFLKSALAGAEDYVPQRGKRKKMMRFWSKKRSGLYKPRKPPTTHPAGQKHKLLHP